MRLILALPFLAALDALLAQIAALRKERDRYLRHLTAGAESLKAYKARAEAAEAVAEKLRTKIAAEARRYANIYDEGTDGRNTFTIFAEWVETRAALTTEADNG